MSKFRDKLEEHVSGLTAMLADQRTAIQTLDLYMGEMGEGLETEAEYAEGKAESLDEILTDVCAKRDLYRGLVEELVGSFESVMKHATGYMETYMQIERFDASVIITKAKKELTP